MDAYVRSETHGGIATIEFFHPQSNSLPASILHQLATAITQAGMDADARVIVLRSGGEGAFCAGASFDELAAVKNESEGVKFFSGFAEVLNAMRNCPRLIVVRVHGKCVGGGVGIAAGADYAIAAEGADVKLSELAVGIGPFVIGPAVKRKIGLSAFSQLAIDAQSWRNADWAKRKGLYAELHPTVEGMNESVGRLADHLAHSSPDALTELKKIFWAGTEEWDQLLPYRASISGRLVTGTHAREAIAKVRGSK